MNPAKVSTRTVFLYSLCLTPRLKILVIITPPQRQTTWTEVLLYFLQNTLQVDNAYTCIIIN